MPLSNDPLSIRNRLALTQEQFWGGLGITQSGGCRYENNRRIPAPTRALMELALLPEKQALAKLRKLRRNYAKGKK